MFTDNILCSNRYTIKTETQEQIEQEFVKEIRLPDQFSMKTSGVKRPVF